MVVLAAAMEPDPSARPLATMLTASMDTNDFFTEAHPKLRPVESPTAGIFLSGACQGPKDIPETVAQAGPRQRRSLVFWQRTISPATHVWRGQTRECVTAAPPVRRCVPMEPLLMWTRSSEGPGRKTVLRRVAQVNPAVCQGCGACRWPVPRGPWTFWAFPTGKSWRRWMLYASERALSAHHCGLCCNAGVLTPERIWPAPTGFLIRLT